VLPGRRGAAKLDGGGVVAVAERGVGLGKEGENGGVGVDLGAVQGSVAALVLDEQLGCVLGVRARGAQT